MLDVKLLMLVSMSAGFAMGCTSFDSIHTKADVMKFAITLSMERKENGTLVFKKKQAKEIFDFFCTNVELVDSDVVPTKDLIDSIFEKYRDYFKDGKPSKQAE